MHISTFLGACLKYDKCRNRRSSPLRPADYSRQQGQAADPPASAVQSAPHLTNSNPADDFSHKISGMQLMLQNYSESNACASFSQHKRQRRDKTRRIRMKMRPQRKRQPIGEQASPEDLRLDHEAARTVSRHFGCQKSSSPAPPAPATPLSRVRQSQRCPERICVRLVCLLLSVKMLNNEQQARRALPGHL